MFSIGPEQPPKERFVGRRFTGDISGAGGAGGTGATGGARASATATRREQLGFGVLYLPQIAPGQLPKEGFVGRGFIRDIRQANEKGL